MALLFFKLLCIVLFAGTACRQ